MSDFKATRSLLLLPVLAVLTICCSQHFQRNNYTAYFGGEVVNPINRYVLFCKGKQVIDTIPLKADNTFFKKFDSLTPGLYSFRHDPEYQYVYFDKNDSLMVHINTKDFDESVVFCGRGDQKNNFLMEVFLKNESDRNGIYPAFDYGIEKFSSTIDASYQKVRSFYEAQKDEIQWSDEFDVYARAAVDFYYYSKKEMYPKVHQMRTGEDVVKKIPADFYAYRSTINFDNAGLADFSPFVSYLSNMLNNIATVNDHKDLSAAGNSMKSNIRKMQIADTLFSNDELRNTMLNTIAFTYLLEDQNTANNQKFLQTFHKFSTDKVSTEEIDKIGLAIEKLEAGKTLPEVAFVDKHGNIVSSRSLPKKKTVLFCWTERLNSHFLASHKKVLELAKRYPEYQFVAVNLDADQQKWTDNLAKYDFGDVLEYRSRDFEDIRNKWAVTRIHRTIILNANGTINNAFANLFDVNFEKNLIAPERQSDLAQAVSY